MKILFFADFHFNSETKISGPNISYLQEVTNDPLFELIGLLKNRYENEKISLLVFLGDYVDGKLPSQEKSELFQRIKRFVKTIEEQCSCIFDENSNVKDRIIFIDGNHDVTRDKEHHDEFERTFGEYITPFSKASGDAIRKYGAPIFNYKQLELLIACISTTENAGAHFSNINVETLSNLIEPLKECDATNHKKILTLLEKQQNADIGTVTTQTIRRFKKKADLKRTTKIVLSHHPFIQMQHATASHFQTVNGPDFFDAARAKGFTFFISGHLHEFYCADILTRGKYSDLPGATIISVPSFINPSDNAPRFVELDINNDDYICRLLTVDTIRDRIDEIDIATNGHKQNEHKQNEHTLLDYEIQDLVKNNIIENASTDRIQSASYDCALGLYYKRYDEDNNTWPDEYTEMQPEKSGKGAAKILIDPGERILLYTHEVFNIPKDMLLHASPRASWIRRGIRVDLSFFVEPGFVGSFCFPVTNINKDPIEINAQEAIMSVVFTKLSGDVEQGWSERHPASLEQRNKKLDK